MNDRSLTCEDIIVLHLYKNRSHLEDRRLPFAVCRQGIGMTEGISDAHVSLGVRNLISLGYVFFEKRYVETKRGPCMAYSLTPMGVLRAKLLGISKVEFPEPIMDEGDQTIDTALLRRRDNALKEKLALLKNLIRP
jgi:hypothetical protein